MEFRLLGPLEVRQAGRPLRLGGPKQQALLALLLIEAGRVVPAERLIDELWGDDPPETARTALQVYVSRLRRELPPDVLRTRPPGYLLEAGDEEVDARRFERLAADGRAALAADRPDRARGLLGEALELWRGPVLGGLDLGLDVRAEAARLHELEIATVEDRVEADLALGRHAELVGELEALVHRHPLRERLRGQLMLALYRSGRQADALEAYRRARSELVSELGIEPGAALQRLERAILAQDAALEPPDAQRPREPARPGFLARERRLATVVFGDLDVAERPDDPERESALLARVHEVARQVVEQAGGRAERGIADALLATFGVAAALEHHAERALAAALSLRARLEEEFGGVVHPRFGIETGETVAEEAGVVGSGGPVTAAARLVRRARPGDILVGERAAAAARGSFDLAVQDGALALTGRLAPGRRPAALVRRTYVGRERELGRLQAIYEHVVRTGVPHLVSVVGEPGIGKSTLVGRLAEELGREPLWLFARCVPFGSAGAYRPLGDVLRTALGLAEDEPAEAVATALGPRRILALTVGADVAGELQPVVVRERLHEAWLAFAGKLAAERPTALAVEDVHWAEPELLELLRATVAAVRGPLLVVATARPEGEADRPGLAAGLREATRLDLQPLPEHEVERLLVALVGADAASRLRKVVVGEADGNPFFVEELVGALADRDELERGGEEIRVPDSIHALLASRLDLLPQAERTTLQLGSVFGRVFPARAARELLALEPDLAALEQRDLVHALPGAGRLAFKHALTREVAYGTLTRAGRAQLHAAVAEWLEQAAEAHDDAAVIAHHYAEAARAENAELAWPDDPERLAELRRRAVSWLRRAGEGAHRRHEIASAIALWRRAVDLAEEPDDQVALWHAIGRAHALRYDGEGFRAALEAALALSPPAETAASLKAELAAVTAARSGMWRRRPEPEVVDGWIADALELSSEDGAARPLALAAKAIWRPRTHRAEAVEAAALAERFDDPDLRRYRFEALTTSAIGVGDYTGALAAVEEWTSAHSDATDPDDRATPAWHAAWASLALGRFADARALAAQIRALTAHLSPHHAIHAVGLELAIEKLAGGWEDALGLVPLVEETVAACVDAGTTCAYVPRSLLSAALAHVREGAADDASRLEAEASALGYEGWELALDATRIKLALARGDVETAGALVRRMPRVGPGSLDALTSRLDALAAIGDAEGVEADAAVAPAGGYLEPFALRALGRVRSDAALVERAAARFDELGLAWHAAATRAG